ncbi:hypothetical protein ACFYOT_31130 [Saccharothrix saharensis]|uniref:hypothetical protein n=1 Tax=Saccharothrix saharensis TaxID=571190 RepID=UPI00367E509C
MRKPLAFVALVVVGLGLFLLLYAARMWLQEGNAHLLAKTNAWDAERALAEGSADDARSEIRFVQSDLDTAARYGANARNAAAGGLALVGVAEVLRRRAVRERRPSVLEAPRPEVRRRT